MQGLLHQLRSRLHKRPDSEHAQDLIRIAITALFSAYMAWSYFSAGGNGAVSITWLVLLSELLVALALFAAIVARPGVSHIRRAIGMLADYTGMGIIMAVEGETAAPLYGVYLWVTIGNGMRYGNRYLRAATALATLSFFTVIMISPYWRASPYLSWGLLVGLAAVPLYFDSLLRQLTSAIQEAQRANEAKSRFLANMSHEFRTPLNGLAGMSELLATTRLDQEQRECVSTIQASTRALMALVEDVLDISAIEAGKLKLNKRDFSPRDLLDSINLILLPQAKAKRLVYEAVLAPDVPEMVHGDMGHVRQVLLNLAGNAVKFTDAGAVRVVVETDGASGSQIRLRFTVSDTGIGIPPAVRGRLFEAFEQAETGLSRRFGGTGLGLTIAKGLTEAMGGTLGFDSTEGQGSRFWFVLPFDPATTPALPEPAGSEAPAAESGPDTPRNVIAFSDPFLRHRARVRSMSILVADDHAANRMVLLRVLQKAGHRVTCVDGGEEVLDAVADADFDAVVCDLHMPGVSGLDLLKQLRVMGSGGGRRTPVVVYSADVTPESIRACEQAGAWAFLPKPVATTRLLDTLADIATSSGTRSQPMTTVTRTDVGAGGESVFDAAVLDELDALGLGENFQREFASQCLRDAEQCLAKLAVACEAKDWEQVREQAHAFKGVVGSLGLIKLAALGGEVMRQPDWQLGRDWRSTLGELRERLAQGRQLIEARELQRNARDGGERTS
ncbi:MAG TPA: ATP-binding protein [Lysobacter sp.]|nr:ATP-binding protein [Lysobacter sp.]